VVERAGGILGAKTTKQYGAELAGRMEDTIIVHELTHALQDQHFDLQKFQISDPLSDAGSARSALIEGDATLTMYNFFSGFELEKMPGFEQVIDSVMQDPKQLLEMSPDMPGSK